MADMIDVGIVSRTFFYVPLWAGLENDAFAAEDLALNIVMLGNASQAPRLLESELQIVIGAPEAALQNAAAGGPLRLVAGISGKLSHSLIVNPRFSRIEDLRGATVGILNVTEGSFFQLKAMLAKHGLHFPTDYCVKEMGGVPSRHKALLDGTIDAGLQAIPWNYVAEDAGMRSLGNIDSCVPDWQYVSVNVNNDRVQENPPLLVRFLRALARATAWVHTHREEAVMIAERELPTRRDYAERAWNYYTSSNALTRDISINRRGLTRVIATQIEAGLLPSSARSDPDAYVVGEYLLQARHGNDL